MFDWAINIVDCQAVIASRLAPTIGIGKSAEN
jgi:hypothetical protein